LPRIVQYISIEGSRDIDSISTWTRYTLPTDNKPDLRLRGYWPLQIYTAVVLAVYRLLILDKLTSFVDIPNAVYRNNKALLEIIGLCRSFLTVREYIIFFVHQSAKDFLLKDISYKILLSGIEDTHCLIFSRSLQVISRILQQDIVTDRF
jgi:hypothetical protein